MLFTDEQKRHWDNHGWIRCNYLLSNLTISRLSTWTDEISKPQNPVTDIRQHYFEQTPRSAVICRTERFLEDHPGMCRVITEGELVEAASELIDEPVVLYKEKINYKHAGGAGFAAHQDATAYSFVKRHITCLVAIDAMTHQNGCLEFARGRFSQLLPDNGDGCLSADAECEMTWDAVPLQPGAVVFFDSFVPHRSGPNNSDHSRRALYLTYNALSEGDHREAYYENRMLAMSKAGNGAIERVSTIGHFLGKAARAMQ